MRYSGDGWGRKRYVAPSNRQVYGFVGGAFLWFAFVVMCVPLAVLAALHWSHTREEAHDLEQLSALRVRHSEALVEYQSARTERDKLNAELRVMRAASAHNAILHRRPTWTVKPLDATIPDARPFTVP